MFEQLTDDEIRDAERKLAESKREREHAKWDAELVGRCFRVIRANEQKLLKSFFRGPTPLSTDEYVTLEESLAVGGDAGRYVYADVVYIHIQKRDDGTLTCSGFEVSHANRKEPYLKIQPVFYSYADFRQYLGSYNHRIGPTKHVDEISKEEYEAAFNKAVANFTDSTR